jgi:hypothetical protein
VDTSVHLGGVVFSICNWLEFAFTLTMNSVCVCGRVLRASLALGIVDSCQSEVKTVTSDVKMRALL